MTHTDNPADTEEFFRFELRYCNDDAAWAVLMRARKACGLAARVAMLNPEVGEIGAGMLAELVALAREACPLKGSE